MGVILKHTFRNIFAKPLMTLFLVVSITICSFAGMMAFDMNNSIKNILRGAFGSMSAQIQILAKKILQGFQKMKRHLYLQRIQNLRFVMIKCMRIIIRKTLKP